MSVIPITTKSFPNGAGNARDASIEQQNSGVQRQLSINQLGRGKRSFRSFRSKVRRRRRTRTRQQSFRRREKRTKRRRRGGANTIQVPQFQMQYTPTGGPGTNPNDQVAQSARTYTQSNANAQYDQQATKMGGGNSRSLMGGSSLMGGMKNPNWSWGCYS